jgi:hypothetical protein
VTPSRARLTLLVALLLGVAGDLLFRADRFGLGVVGWVGLAVGSAIALGWEPLVVGARARDRLIALVVASVAALGLVLRDAPTLTFYNVIAILTAAALATWPSLGRSIARFRVRDLVRALGRSAGAAMIGTFFLALRDVAWERALPSDGRRFRALTVGTLLAAPPVFIVAGLLGEADPVFGEFLTSWQRLGLEDVAGHVILAGVIAWPMAGWMRAQLVHPTVSGPSFLAPPARIDFIGVAPALYAIVGLLAAFLGLQARALFGGAEYVEATVGLTYAEYARSGFFELIAVTAIVLGLLLVGDWALDRSASDATRRFRTAGWALVGLLGVLMASALHRMWVYVSFFGLSDTRLYATAGMAWVGMALAWFGWTILRGARARFGVGLLVASAGWIATLNLINPERVVVQVNLARALAGKEFDVPYHLSLSPDATLALVEAAGRLSPASCDALLAGLSERLEHPRTALADWRNWSLPLSRADLALRGEAGWRARQSCG